MGERYTSNTDDRKVAAADIEAAAAALCAGQVVAYPTETFYALGAHPRRADGLQQVLRLKDRKAADKPLLLLLDSLDRIDDWITTRPSPFAALAGRFWPGPLTMILPAAAAVPELITGGGGTVALRLTSHPVARQLIGCCGGALTGTSANPAGAPPPVDADGVMRGFGDRRLRVLDAGTTPGGQASTLLDLSGGEPRIRRPGAVPDAEIEATLRLL